MAEVTLKGVIKGISEPFKIGNSGKQKFEFVIAEQEGDYPNVFKFETFNKKVIDNVFGGDLVEVTADVKGREWSKDGRSGIIISLQAWKDDAVKVIEANEPPVVESNKTTLKKQGKVEIAQDDVVDDNPDDLPF